MFVTNTKTYLLTGAAGFIGSSCERQNIQIIKIVCSILNKICYKAYRTKYESQITCIKKDCLGYDRYYTINVSRIKRKIAWQLWWDSECCIYKMDKWYLNNLTLIKKILSGKHSCKRPGLGDAHE